MQVGCGLVSVRDIGPASEAGFDYIEFMGKYLVSASGREFLKILNTITKYDIRCRGLNGYCPEEIIIAGPGFDLGKARRYARTVADRAKELDVVVVGIGSPSSRKLPEDFDRKIARKQLKDFLKVTAEELGRYGITVCLEALAPCYCNFVNTVEEAVEITREIGWSSIRTVLDFYNMEYSGEADSDVKPWLNEIAHVHISDDAGSPFQRDFLREEKSGIHKRRLYRLFQAGYRGLVTVEVDLPVNGPKSFNSLHVIKNAY